MRDKKLLFLFYGVALMWIALPLVSLFFSGGTSGGASGDGCHHDGGVSLLDPIVLNAVWISFKSTVVTMLIVVIVGIPAAYACARLDFKGKDFLDLILNLPLVLPPAVAGLLLLLTFGRRGWIGQYLYLLGIQIPFSLVGVIMAQLFVALPLFIKTAAEGFRKVDLRMEQTAMTLGDTPFQAFRKVTLPLAKGSLLTAGVMAWARGLAEFGATIMFAGNLQGKTQTLPLAIYSAMETDMDAAMSIARLMVLISLSILVGLYLCSRKGKVAGSGMMKRG